MQTRTRSIQGAALLVSALALQALLGVPETMSPVGVAGVATLLLAITMIVKLASAPVRAPLPGASVDRPSGMGARS